MSFTHQSASILRLKNLIRQKTLLKNGFPRQYPGRLSVRSYSAQILTRNGIPLPARAEADEAHLHRLRNIGIFAHINAGKTTTTEAILFTSKEISTMGCVDDGTTAMDFMEEEKERKITIRSAATTLTWSSHHINIVDTPGHIDFGAEVRRAAAICDGSIVVVDAQRGVQAQTKSVWNELEYQETPRIIYINKLDKAGSLLTETLAAIKSLPNCNPIPLSIPLPMALEHAAQPSPPELGMQYLFNFSTMKATTCIPSSPHLKRPKQLIKNLSDLGLDAHDLKTIQTRRSEFVELLAEADDIFADHYTMNGEDELTSKMIDEAIRRITLSSNGQPVLCGSSLNVIGVDCLLNAVLNYLPSPYCSKTRHTRQTNPVVVFASPKVCRAYSKQRDDVRVSMPQKQTLPTKKDFSMPSALMQTQDLFMMATNNTDSMKNDNIKESLVANSVRTSFQDPGHDKKLNALWTVIPQSNVAPSLLVFKSLYDHQGGRLIFVRAYSGVITVGNRLFNSTQGIWETIAGIYRVKADRYIKMDCLAIGDIGVIRGFNKTVTGDTLISDNEFVPFSFERGHLDVPPTSFVSIEAENAKQDALLDRALDALCLEDPSLRHKVDKNLGQRQLWGAGELHLEIAKSRLLTDFNLKVTFGSLQIHYMETLRDTIEAISDDECKFRLYKLIDKGLVTLFLSNADQIHPSPIESKNSRMGSVNMNVDDIKKDINMTAGLKNQLQEEQLKNRMWLIPKYLDDFDTKKNVSFELKETGYEAIKTSLPQLTNEVCQNLYQMINDSLLANGPIMGCALVGLDVEFIPLLKPEWNNLNLLRQKITLLINKCLNHLRRHQNESLLIEPIVNVIIEIPKAFDYQVRADLAHAYGAEFEETAYEEESQLSKIVARVPLRTTSDCNRRYRCLTKGEVQMQIQPCGYKVVELMEMEKIMKQAGFEVLLG